MLPAIMLTGAAGLIGQAVGRHLLDKGRRVVGVGRGAEVPDSCSAWLQADLEEEELPGSAFSGIEAVVHLAAIPSPGVVSDGQLFRNNICSSFNILNAAGKSGIKKAIVASSTSIYGVVWANTPVSPSTVPLTEASSLRCADAYSLGKEVDEATARMMSRKYGMNVASLRFPNVSTPADVHDRSRRVEADPHYASRELWGYLTLDDAAIAIEMALDHDFSGAVVANIVSAQALANVNAPLLARTYFPNSEYIDNGGSTGGYSTSAAADLFGFTASSIL